MEKKYRNVCGIDYMYIRIYIYIYMYNAILYVHYVVCACRIFNL